MKNMKKLLCFIITFTLVLSSISVAYAKQSSTKEQTKTQKKTEQQEKKSTQQTTKSQKTTTQQTTKSQQQTKSTQVKDKKQTFKINGSPVIKYGKYKLPISPITKGMGATVTFDKTTAVLTVTKDTTTIVINFIDKTVTVNGVADTNSGIFTASNSKKSTVLIKYIANKLGVRVNVDDDKITVTVPGLDLPKNVKVIPVGPDYVENTLNSTTLYLNATADITAGQAVKAELYVGSKLVATDADIATTDTTVTFTTSDGTPTNAELQAAVPAGGVVTVKLYNANNESVTSTAANPTLVVDYAAPTISGVSSAAFSISGSALTLNVSGASVVGDKVDVTKISLTDTALNTTYQLTAGSIGTVTSDTVIVIKLSPADLTELAGFGSSTVFLNIAADSLLYDAAGNTSPAFAAIQIVPVAVTQ